MKTVVIYSHSVQRNHSESLSQVGFSPVGHRGDFAAVFAVTGHLVLLDHPAQFGARRLQGRRWLRGRLLAALAPLLDLAWLLHRPVVPGHRGQERLLRFFAARCGNGAAVVAASLLGYEALVFGKLAAATAAGGM